MNFLRSKGISYKKLEELGYSLPVVNYNINYKKPFYDDILIIETTLSSITLFKLVFKYNTFNEDGDLLNTVETTLVFVDSISGKLSNSPQFFLDKLKE